MKTVILLAIIASVIDAGLLHASPLTHTLRGGFHYKPSKDDLINYYRARYYARKAHDIASLRRKIFGLGSRFYGFKYKLRHFGSVHPPLGYLSHYIQPISPMFPVSKYYIPKTYQTSHSKNFAYGKEFSTMAKNYYPVEKFPHSSKFGGISRFPGGWDFKGPTFSPQVPIIGYDSIYGVRYGDSPKLIPNWGARTMRWDGSPLSKYHKGASIYGSNYGGVDTGLQFKKLTDAYDLNHDAVGIHTKKDIGVYDSNYEALNSGFHIKDKHNSNHDVVNSDFYNNKGAGLYDPNYGALNTGLHSKDEVHVHNHDIVNSDIYNNKGTGEYVPNYGTLEHGFRGKEGTNYDSMYGALNSGFHDDERIAVKNYGAGNPGYGSVDGSNVYDGVVNSGFLDKIGGEVHNSNYADINAGLHHVNPILAAQIGNTESHRSVPSGETDFHVPPGRVYLPDDHFIVSDGISHLGKGTEELSVLGSSQESARASSDGIVQKTNKSTAQGKEK